MEIPHDFCRFSKIKGFTVISYDFTDPVGKEKFCPTCRQWLDVDDFYFDNHQAAVKGRTDDRRWCCKKCDNAERKRRSEKQKESVSAETKKTA